MNKTCRVITEEEYKEIITTMREGSAGFKPNNRVATALMLEANLGLRISDVLQLRLKDIIKEGSRYHLNIIEQKTQKKRSFTVPVALYQFIKLYCVENGIADGEVIFPISERAVQKQLKLVCDYLELEGISSHSFRKMFATSLYKDSGYNIQLVSRLLQHSSTSVTQRYIGLEPREIEEALENHLKLDV